ncbi:MAG TPA: DoxX family protein [Dongiaceae bacterium]
MKALNLLARILMATIFVLSGFHKLVAFSGTAAFIGTLGYPVPQLFTVLAILFELGGAILLLIGFKTRLASAALIIFLILATLTVHVQNMVKQPARAQEESVQILKNIAILGGLIRFYTAGAGGYAVDRDA